MARNSLVEDMDFNGDHDLSFYGIDVCMVNTIILHFPLLARGFCAKTILELVHIDVVGPIITFHGVCQNVIWLSLLVFLNVLFLIMKTKLDVLDKFKVFKAFMENQIEKKIKTIKCDDDGGI